MFLLRGNLQVSLANPKTSPSDLTTSNIAFELQDVELSTSSQICQLLGPIRAENLRLGNGSYSSHAPKQVIETPNLLDYTTLTQVRIIDFGQSFFVDHPPKSLGVPIDFFPPEVCFGYLPSTQSDIWQLACILYQINSKELLFPTFFRIFEILVGTIIDNIGPIPQHWKGRFHFDEYGYVEPGQEVDTSAPEPEWWFEEKSSEKTIGGRLARQAAHLSTQQRDDFVRLILDMVVYEPAARVSALDVIRRLRLIALLDENSGPSDCPA